MSKIIADIGGTNARFALVDDAGSISAIEVLPCADFKSPAEAAQSYLDRIGARPKTGAFAVATPLDGTDIIAMTNHVWNFSISETMNALGLSSLRVINDFAALAYAVPHLTDKDRYQLGNGEAMKNMPIAIIGPGTGLGVAGVVFADGKPVTVTTEGGHVTMPAATAREFALFDWLKKSKYHHISAERVVSGKGLVNLYHAVCGVDGLDLPELTPAEITGKALDESCLTCVEVLDLFCHFLGVVAGNLALSYGASGGLYIAGGIVPQLGEYFKASRFRESYLAKGRFSEYMERIPTYVITHPYPGLEGLKNIA
ncbi:MAG TPA: glucokinase [Patescibacteria group bacterium]|nr:glucokinase [Patescibacteria group bacterium]